MFYKTLLGFSEGVIRLTHNASAVLLAISFVLVFYQVITRFVFDDSSAWSEVLARAVIIWTVFMVLGPAIRLGRMIPIDAVRHLFSKDVQIWIIRAVTIAVTLFCLILVWFGIQMTERVIHQQVALIDVSVAWFYAALPIGAFAALPGVFLAHLDAEAEHRGENNNKEIVK